MRAWGLLPCVCRGEEGYTDMDFVVKGFPPHATPLSPVVWQTSHNSTHPHTPSQRSRGHFLLAPRLLLIGGPMHRATSLAALWGHTPIKMDSVCWQAHTP